MILEMVKSAHESMVVALCAGKGIFVLGQEGLTPT